LFRTIEKERVGFMKKIGLFLVLMMFLFAGCGEEKTGYLECNNSRNEETFSTKTEVKVYYENNIVKTVESIEKVTSDDKSILEYFEEALIESYASLSENYGGYTYNFEYEGNTLISKTTINYEVMDLKALVNDDSSMSTYVNANNQITKTSIKAMYSVLGLTCK